MGMNTTDNLFVDSIPRVLSYSHRLGMKYSVHFVHMSVKTIATEMIVSKPAIVFMYISEKNFVEAFRYLQNWESSELTRLDKLHGRLQHSTQHPLNIKLPEIVEVIRENKHGICRKEWKLCLKIINDTFQHIVAQPWLKQPAEIQHYLPRDKL